MSRIAGMLIVVLVAASLLAGCGGGGGGAETRTLTVQDVSGAAGTDVTVHVKLNSFLGVGGYHIVLNYDKNKLALIATTVLRGSGVPVTSIFTRNTLVPGVIDATVTGTDLFTGTDVLVATFTIIAPSPLGTKNNITMPTATLADSNGLPITVTEVGGKVTTN
jgi:hypothetical protein